jgi:HK97 gp10 family phage protein
MNRSWSDIRKVINELDKAQEKKLDIAAVHLRTKIKDKLKNKHTSFPGEPPGKKSGNLIKGVIFTRNPGKRFVGMGKPAYHAHLLEFGTGPRTVKNYRGKGVAVAVGSVAPRPFLIPTFEEEKENVKKLLSETWL